MAKNKIKTSSLAFFSLLASTIDFGKLAILYFGVWSLSRLECKSCY